MPTPPGKDSPAGNRAAYTNFRFAGVTTKSTINASSKKFVDGKRKADFANLRREERASEQELKSFEVIAPQTKSVVFSSGAAPIVMRPVATTLTGTSNPPAALIETAQAKAPFADLFLVSGLETSTLTTPLAARYGAPRGGLLVVSVKPQSAAFRAGLRPDDVIEALNKQFVSGTNTPLPQNLKATNDFSLTIVRGNQRLILTLTPSPSAH